MKIVAKDEHDFLSDHTLPLYIRFERAVSLVSPLLAGRNLFSVDSADLAKAYALFKQATIGDCNVRKPSFLSINFVARTKWDAWDKLRGKSMETAKEEYVDTVVDFLEPECDGGYASVFEKIDYNEALRSEEPMLPAESSPSPSRPRLA